MSAEVLRDGAVITVAKFHILGGSCEGPFWQLINVVIFDNEIADIDFVDVALLLHWVYWPFRAQHCALWLVWAISDATIKDRV